MSKIKIALIILGLVLFPIAVQVLFCFHAPVRVLEANWTAGEILTYVGTAFLGFIAFIQNDSLKKANDEAQEKLAQLTSEANELSVLARIIDYELNKKATLLEDIEAFEKASNLQNILSAVDLDCTVNLPSLIEKESILNDAFLHLCTSTRMHYDDDKIGEDTGYLKAIRTMYETIKRMIKIIKEECKNAMYEEQAIDINSLKLVVEEVKAQKKEMEKCKSIYLTKKTDSLNNIIYGENIDIHSLKEIF